MLTGLREVKAETLRDTLAEVRAGALLDALADWPNDAEKSKELVKAIRRDTNGHSLN